MAGQSDPFNTSSKSFASSVFNRFNAHPKETPLPSESPPVKPSPPTTEPIETSSPPVSASQIATFPSPAPLPSVKSRETAAELIRR